jgi:hypothetical protein
MRFADPLCKPVRRTPELEQSKNSQLTCGETKEIKREYQINLYRDWCGGQRQEIRQFGQRTGTSLLLLSSSSYFGRHAELGGNSKKLVF